MQCRQQTTASAITAAAAVKRVQEQEWIQIENEMSFNEASTDAVSEAHRHAWMHRK